MILRFNKKELAKLIESTEAVGTDATELRSLLAEVEQDEEHIVMGSQSSDEEYLAEKRAQTEIEYGTDLECMICHDKFDHLLSGTCEVCFREWMLGTKPKGWIPRMKELL